MAEVIPLYQPKSGNRSLGIVLLHGLDGDAVKTWHPSNDPTAFWPQWLGEELGDVGLWTVSYPASSSNWRGYSQGVIDRAANLLPTLASHELFNASMPVVFVAHSLGGLVVKQLLRASSDAVDPKLRVVAQQTQGLLFLGTPQVGSKVSVVSRLPFARLFRPSAATMDLEKGSAFLRDLASWFRTHAQGHALRISVLRESRPTLGFTIVDPVESDPGIAGVIPVPLDEDHVSICKPVNRQAQSYDLILSFIRGCQANHAAKLKIASDGVPSTPTAPSAPKPAQQIQPTARSSKGSSSDLLSESASSTVSRVQHKTYGLCIAKTLHETPPESLEWIKSTNYRDLPVNRVVAIEDRSGEPLTVFLRYLDALPLSEVIRGGNTIRGALLGDIVLGVLTQLGQAQSDSPGIVHRDVTPSNILLAFGRPEHGAEILGSYCNAKLIDWEWGCIGDRNQTPLGVPGFSPPEVLAGKANPSSDLYSLMSTAYFCIHGRPLLPGTDPWQLEAELIEAFGDCQLSNFWNIKVLLQALSLDPKERPGISQRLFR